jgi:hypothetical protein
VTTRRNILRTLVIAVIGTTQGFAQAVTPFSVRSQPDGWKIAYHAVPIGRTHIMVDGREHVLFTEKTVWTPSAVGKPLLPVETIALALPPGSSISVELLDPIYDETPGIDIAPAPRQEVTGQAGDVFVKDGQSYAADGLVPSQEAWADPPFSFRRIRVAVVHLAAVRYNPRRHVIRTLMSGVLQVTLNGRGTSQSPLKGVTSDTDPFFEPLYRSLVANPDEARQWGLPGLLKPTPRADPSRDWFTPGHSYIKILIAEDGWYHLSPSAVQIAGGAALFADTSSASLYYRGNRVPVVVRPDSSIEFFGERKRGDSTYVDFYTDTSAYWLTWGETSTARYVPSLIDAPVADSLSSARALIHLESNTDYYEGTGDSEITKNGTVPGEGWVWEYYYPGTSVTHTFTIDYPDPLADSADVRVRMFGTTVDPSSPSHRARFWVNDSLVGEITFPIRSEGLFHAVFPSRYLKTGTNSIRILSDPPQSGVNQFFLDWIEITYSRQLHAVGDLLDFTLFPKNGAGPHEIRADGFTSPDLEVFDVSLGRRVGGVSVAGDSVAGFSLEFQDTISNSRRYLARTHSAASTANALPAKVFGDLRSLAGGADYIIIAHRNFMAEAQQLAAHRAATNGVRAVVVDVQDIYDQFNFGMMNAEPIKDFLNYAYTSWIPPAPSYLVMFGDASWDFHRYKASTVNENFVPGYGVPVGDNWFTCFGPANTVVPSMFTGRIPVQTAADAQHVVEKLIGYDAYRPAAWNKRYLFITGGGTPQEQATFNALSNSTISSYVLPAPLGGTPLTVYKASADPINGDYTDIVRSHVQEGVVFLTFLGHSGGRYWGVDIGKPQQLGNTNGRLPFVSSVSCNVGAFAEPATTTLSEDFLLADNEGAVAAWASSSLGYPYIGTRLVNAFLAAMKDESLRTFGELTTEARVKVWEGAPSDYAVAASANLNPLIGDPLSRMAVPTTPDLAIPQDGLGLLNPSPSVLDSTLSLKTVIQNYGLVPSDSVEVNLDDTFNGKTTPLFTRRKIPPVFGTDSITVHWTGTDQIGLHTFRATVDPLAFIPDFDRGNNSLQTDAYVYANQLAIVGPLNSTVVPPGSVRLRVSSPIGADSASLQAEFELDTSATFDSPGVVRSGAVMPGPASTEWHTPVLPEGRVYYWRSRTFTPTVSGAWIRSSFSTTQDVPPSPLVRWKQSRPSHIASGFLVDTAPTDSGVTIQATPPMELYARSVGYNASTDQDFYSILKVGAQTYYAYWWNQGTGFIGGRVNAFTGEVSFRSFDLPSKAVQADSMTAFIDATPPGDFMMFSVIFDGRTNVTVALRSALKALGSALIDSVWPGYTWCMIARKGANGPGMVPLEHWDRTAVVADSMVVPNIYSLGAGTIRSIALPMPQTWKSFTWQTGGVPGITSETATISGYHRDGRKDSLVAFSSTTLDADLTDLTTRTADSSFVRFDVTAHLASADALVSPVLHEWSLDFQPSADLAITQRTLHAPKIALPKGTSGSITLTVYNIGYQTSHDPRAVLSLVGAGNVLVPLAATQVDSIPASGSATVQIQFSTQGLPHTFTIVAEIVPSGTEKELIWENNTALYGFTTYETLDAGVAVYADGTRLLDGDYVAAVPHIQVVLSNVSDSLAATPQVDLFVDGKLTSSPGGAGGATGGGQSVTSGGEYTFQPSLSNGMHELRVRILRPTPYGQMDSLTSSVAVNVLEDSRILQFLNYPNPFSRDTWFTFIVTGGRAPDHGAIRIYTIAGRKIREIDLGAGELVIGFNRIRWDGRDQDGDEVANGYYLFSLALDTDGKTVRALGKMVRVR